MEPDRPMARAHLKETADGYLVPPGNPTGACEEIPDLHKLWGTAHSAATTPARAAVGTALPMRIDGVDAGRAFYSFARAAKYSENRRCAKV